MTITTNDFEEVKEFIEDFDEHSTNLTFEQFFEMAKAANDQYDMTSKAFLAHMFQIDDFSPLNDFVNNKTDKFNLCDQSYNDGYYDMLDDINDGVEYF